MRSQKYRFSIICILSLIVGLNSFALDRLLTFSDSEVIVRKILSDEPLRNQLAPELLKNGVTQESLGIGTCDFLLFRKAKRVMVFEKQILALPLALQSYLYFAVVKMQDGGYTAFQKDLVDLGNALKITAKALEFRLKLGPSQRMELFLLEMKESYRLLDPTRPVTADDITDRFANYIEVKTKLVGRARFQALWRYASLADKTFAGRTRRDRLTIGSHVQQPVINESNYSGWRTAWPWVADSKKMIYRPFFNGYLYNSGLAYLLMFDYMLMGFDPSYFRAHSVFGRQYDRRNVILITSYTGGGRRIDLTDAFNIGYDRCEANIVPVATESDFSEKLKMESLKTDDWDTQIQ